MIGLLFFLFLCFFVFFFLKRVVDAFFLYKEIGLLDVANMFWR